MSNLGCWHLVSAFMKPATVKEIIEELQKLPQDLPCFFRPKYHGTVKYHENVPVHRKGISEMHPDPKIYPDEPRKYVCFLC